MAMTYLVSIISRVLALTDKVLNTFVGTPYLIDLNSMGYSNCTSVFIVNVSTTTCGDDLAKQISQLFFNGVGLLNGVLAALSATNMDMLTKQSAGLP